jgi:hypothetical protein
MASASGDSATAAATKLRDEARAAAQRLADEAASLHSTNTERSKPLQADAELLTSAADALERVRAAADALKQERATPSSGRLPNFGTASATIPATMPPPPRMTTRSPPLPMLRPWLICTARPPPSRTSRT